MKKKITFMKKIQTVKIYPIFILKILRKKIHLLKRIINQ